MAKPESIRIFLIPSGRTSWQAEGRLQGNTDLPLSDQGLEEVKKLASMWEPGEVRLIHSSPDEASRQTAAVLAGMVKAKVKPIEDLAEINLGLWQGLQRSALKERYPKAYGQWCHDPSTVIIPQGETLTQAVERLHQAVVKLIDRANGHPLVLVLRPVMFELCENWLTGHPTTEWRNEDAPETIQQLDLTAPQIEELRQGRKNRGITA